MKGLLPLIPLLILCLYGTPCNSASEFNSPHIGKLQKMAKSASDGIIKFNLDTYTTFVMDAERNYSVFMLFTATHHKYKCTQCRVQAESYSNFGKSYARYYGNTYDSPQFYENPFFLGQLEPDVGMDIFQQYGFSNVPHFTYIAPGKKKVSSIPDHDFFRNTNADAGEFSSFIESKIGVQIPIYVDPTQQYMTFAAAIFFGVAISKVLYQKRNKLVNPMAWFVITMGLYFIVMAGLAYNIIRTPPFSEIRQDGSHIFISPQARSQFVAEGLIIGALMTGTGLLFVVVGDIVPRFKVGGTQRLVFWCAAGVLFMCLVSINNIFFTKYHMPAFRIR